MSNKLNKKPSLKASSQLNNNSHSEGDEQDESDEEPLVFASDMTVNDFSNNTFYELTGNEFNVLLLGQSGVGKTTFINSLTNYINYEDFNYAKTKDLEIFIPGEFTIFIDGFKERVIKFGSSAEEPMLDEQIKIYTVNYKGDLVRIFNSIGIGDARGIEQDKLNLSKVFDVLAGYEKLHAICVLLKPNEFRLTAIFEFYIKHLLCHFHKSAVNNIIFVFTNSRGTFYKPGDTVKPLTAILNNIKSTSLHVQVPFLIDKNVFCFDNEAFRFLLAKKSGVQFIQKQEEEFSKSWEITGNECRRMLDWIVNADNVSGLQSHHIEDTMTVIMVRRAIFNLSKPLADSAKKIHTNLDNLNDQIKMIENNASDKNSKIQIKNKESSILTVEHVIKTIKAEEDKLIKHMAKLVAFLKQNAILVYNDTFQDYLMQAIESEKAIAASNNKNIVIGLENMLKAYQHEKRNLDNVQNQQENVDNISADEVKNVINELNKIKNC